MVFEEMKPVSNLNREELADLIVRNFEFKFEENTAGPLAPFDKIPKPISLTITSLSVNNIILSLVDCLPT